jgi:hypothetical protein
MVNAVNTLIIKQNSLFCKYFAIDNFKYNLNCSFAHGNSEHNHLAELYNLYPKIIII